MCYQYEASDLLNYSASSEDWFATCQEFPEEYRTTCFLGIGTNIPSPSKLPADVPGYCAAALPYGTEAYETCLRGAINAVDSHYNGEPEAFVQVCENVDLASQTYCFEQSVNLLQRWQIPTEEMQTFCENIPDINTQERCIERL